MTVLSTPFPSVSTASHGSTDQASILRARMATPAADAALDSSLTGPGPCVATSVAVAGGKGGVGKTVIALNLAIQLSQLQQKVCLIDASSSLGHLDFMSGQTSYWNLGHVLAGARELSEVTVNLFPGVELITGAVDMNLFHELSGTRQQNLRRQFQQIETQYDFLIVDTGSGFHSLNQPFIGACGTVMLVTTTEPTSITNTYCCLKQLSGAQFETHLVFNRADTLTARHCLTQLKQTASAFLNTQQLTANFLPEDSCVTADVAHRLPTCLTHPESPFSMAIERLATQLLHSAKQSSVTPLSYFERLIQLQLASSES